MNIEIKKVVDAETGKVEYEQKDRFELAEERANKIGMVVAVCSLVFVIVMSVVSFVKLNEKKREIEHLRSDVAMYTRDYDGAVNLLKERIAENEELEAEVARLKAEVKRLQPKPQATPKPNPAPQSIDSPAKGPAAQGNAIGLSGPISPDDGSGRPQFASED